MATVRGSLSGVHADRIVDSEDGDRRLDGCESDHLDLADGWLEHAGQPVVPDRAGLEVEPLRSGFSLVVCAEWW